MELLEHIIELKQTTARVEAKLDANISADKERDEAVAAHDKRLDCLEGKWQWAMGIATAFGIIGGWLASLWKK